MTQTRHRLLCMKVVHTIKFWLIVCCVTRDPVGSSVQSHKYSKQCYVHSLYVIKLHACAGKELTKHPLIPLRAWRLHDFKYKLLLLQQEKLAALLTWSRLAWLCNGQGEASLATRLLVMARVRLLWQLGCMLIPFSGFLPQLLWWSS